MLFRSIFSILYAVLTGKIYDAVGASGAIFGLVGALFILVVARDLKRRSHSQGTVEILDQRGRQMPGAYESVSVGRIIRYFLHLHFKCYPKSPLYPPPLPCSPTHPLPLLLSSAPADHKWGRCLGGPTQSPRSRPGRQLRGLIHQLT